MFDALGARYGNETTTAISGLRTRERCYCSGYEVPRRKGGGIYVQKNGTQIQCDNTRVVHLVPQLAALYTYLVVLHRIAGGIEKSPFPRECVDQAGTQVIPQHEVSLLSGQQSLHRLVQRERGGGGNEDCQVADSSRRRYSRTLWQVPQAINPTQQSTEQRKRWGKRSNKTEGDRWRRRLLVAIQLATEKREGQLD